jgi:hypothetical protein
MTVSLFAAPKVAARSSHLYSIPDEVSSKHYVVTVDGRTTPVLHATTWYYLLNFEVSKAAKIAVTASDPHYWDAGVEIQPMRFDQLSNPWPSEAVDLTSRRSLRRLRNALPVCEYSR